MSLFGNLISWTVSSGISDGVKRLAVNELTQAAQQFVDKTRSHAPDMANNVEQQMVSALGSAISGALTRSKQ